MILLELFLVFVQIGALAFGGGYAVLPLIQKLVVEDRGWLSTAEMTDLVSLSQMTPGPIAINSATFVGTKMAGIPGAVVATVGNVIPQFILMMILSYFIFNDRKLPFIDKILSGLKPGIVGLIAVAAIKMTTSSLFGEKAVAMDNLVPVALITFVIGFIISLKSKTDVIHKIIIGGVIGIVLNTAITNFL